MCEGATAGSVHARHSRARASVSPANTRSHDRNSVRYALWRVRHVGVWRTKRWKGTNTRSHATHLLTRAADDAMVVDGADRVDGRRVD